MEDQKKIDEIKEVPAYPTYEDIVKACAEAIWDILEEVRVTSKKPEKATPKQKAYMRKLGIKFSEDISKKDASSLLDAALNKK